MELTSIETPLDLALVIDAVQSNDTLQENVELRV